MPLCGSSGFISPSSIFVKIILASRLNISSTLSPLKALTSTLTGMFDALAHFDAVSADTSRPSGATVAFNCEPKPDIILVEFTDPPASNGNEEAFEDTELGVVAGKSIKDGVPFAKSALFPARTIVRLGDARARASLRKGCRPPNVECDVMSYTKTAPAAPR